MPQYKYSPLPTGSSIIRLLCLLPNKENTAQIKCQLVNYSLSTTDKGHHLYDALSYVWGSESKPQCILIDNHALPVTNNLYAALLHLRDRQLQRMLWVDAICINQQDDREKAHQIQFMPTIYGQASYVIVWLGEAADHSDRALENIRFAAEYEPSSDESTIVLKEKINHTAILALLQRPWFRRIWVLQEVGAARSIIVMCGPMKINGYTFSSGLKGLHLCYKADPGLEGLVRSIIYLMRGAIFRPAYILQPHGALSLGELIDMYHTREATKKHDKVYALLGMSSDDPITAGLLPNYKLPWDILFQRVIISILPQVHSVKTWPDTKFAVIKGGGYILVRINSVKDDYSRYDRQCVQITFNSTPLPLSYKYEWGTQWTLQASAKAIQEGDILCLLQGASEPSIIGMCEDYFTVKMINATPQQNRQGNMDKRFRKALFSIAGTPRDILLVWNWDISGFNLKGGYKLNIPTKFNDAASDSRINLESKRLRDFTLIIEDIFWMVMEIHDEQMMKSLLDQLLPKHLVSETMVKVAAGNTAAGAKMIQLLLNQRGASLPISEDIVKAAACNTAAGAKIIQLLLERRDVNILISEDIVKVAAGNTTTGAEIIQLLLNRRGTRLPISEDVVKVAAGNTAAGAKIIRLLIQSGALCR